MRVFKRVLCLGLMLVLLTALSVPALASDIKEDYDVTIPNTLDLTLTAGGGTLKIYKVADRTSGTSIAATSDFAGSGLPTNMNDVAANSVSLAASLLQ